MIIKVKALCAAILLIGLVYSSSGFAQIEASGYFLPEDMWVEYITTGTLSEESIYKFEELLKLHPASKNEPTDTENIARSLPGIFSELHTSSYLKYIEGKASPRHFTISELVESSSSTKKVLPKSVLGLLGEFSKQSRSLSIEELRNQLLNFLHSDSSKVWSQFEGFNQKKFDKLEKLLGQKIELNDLGKTLEFSSKLTFAQKKKVLKDYLEYLSNSVFLQRKIDKIRSIKITDIDSKELTQKLHKDLDIDISELGRSLAVLKKFKVDVPKIEKRAIVHIVEVPPYIGTLRGICGGDCSTSSSFLYSFMRGERVFFLYKTDSKGKMQESPGGYMTMSSVILENGKKATYIKDLRGSDIDAERFDLIAKFFEKMAKSYDRNQAVLIANREFIKKENRQTEAMEALYSVSSRQNQSFEFTDIEDRDKVKNLQNVIEKSFVSDYDSEEKHKDGNKFKNRRIDSKYVLDTKTIVFSSNGVTKTSIAFASIGAQRLVSRSATKTLFSSEEHKILKQLKQGPKDYKEMSLGELDHWYIERLETLKIDVNRKARELIRLNNIHKYLQISKITGTADNLLYRAIESKLRGSNKGEIWFNLTPKLQNEISNRSGFNNLIQISIVHGRVQDVPFLMDLERKGMIPDERLKTYKKSLKFGTPTLVDRELGIEFYESISIWKEAFSKRKSTYEGYGKAFIFAAKHFLKSISHESQEVQRKYKVELMERSGFFTAAFEESDVETIREALDETLLKESKNRWLSVYYGFKFELFEELSVFDFFEEYLELGSGTKMKSLMREFKKLKPKMQKTIISELNKRMIEGSDYYSGAYMIEFLVNLNVSGIRWQEYFSDKEKSEHDRLLRDFFDMDKLRTSKASLRSINKFHDVDYYVGEEAWGFEKDKRAVEFMVDSLIYHRPTLHENHMRDLLFIYEDLSNNALKKKIRLLIGSQIDRDFIADQKDYGELEEWVRLLKSSLKLYEEYKETSGKDLLPLWEKNYEKPELICKKLFN